MVMPRPFLGSVVDRVEAACFAHAGVGQNGDRRGQRGLTMVHVTDGTDVDVRLGTLECLLLPLSFRSLIVIVPVRPLLAVPAAG